jgi:hypothetical protein
MRSWSVIATNFESTGRHTSPHMLPASRRPGMRGKMIVKKALLSLGRGRPVGGAGSAPSGKRLTTVVQSTSHMQFTAASEDCTMCASTIWPKRSAPGDGSDGSPAIGTDERKKGSKDGSASKNRVIASLHCVEHKWAGLIRMGMAG